MINEAMFKPNPDDLNAFTRVLLDMILKNPGYPIAVTMRNDNVAYVTYDPVVLKFHSPDFSKAWCLDGSSVTSYDFDIIEIEGV